MDSKLPTVPEGEAQGRSFFGISWSMCECRTRKTTPRLQHEVAKRRLQKGRDVATDKHDEVVAVAAAQYYQHAQPMGEQEASVLFDLVAQHRDAVSGHVSGQAFASMNCDSVGFLAKFSARLCVLGVRQDTALDGGCDLYILEEVGRARNMGLVNKDLKEAARRRHGHSGGKECAGGVRCSQGRVCACCADAHRCGSAGLAAPVLVSCSSLVSPEAKGDNY